MLVVNAGGVVCLGAPSRTMFSRALERKRYALFCLVTLVEAEVFGSDRIGSDRRCWACRPLSVGVETLVLISDLPASGNISLSASGAQSKKLDEPIFSGVVQAAGSAAADAGQTLKDTASGDPTSAAKSAASDVGDAAKKAAAKLPGVGSKPVAFSSAGLQVNVDLPNPVEQVPSPLCLSSSAAW